MAAVKPGVCKLKTESTLIPYFVWVLMFDISAVLTLAICIYIYTCIHARILWSIRIYVPFPRMNCKIQHSQTGPKSQKNVPAKI